MGKIKIARPGLRTLSPRQLRSVPKVAAPTYTTPEYRAWRATVIERAGGRCEVIEGGARCERAAPLFRMYADHVREVRDGGALYDPDNGQCKCAVHHGRKTAQARADRR